MNIAQLRPISTGATLVEALNELGEPGEGWVQAIGSVEQVELRVAGNTGEVRRLLKGRYTLVSLAGPLGGPYAVQLVRDSGGISETAAGLLSNARAVAVSACVVVTGAPEPRENHRTVLPAPDEHPTQIPAADETALEPAAWATVAARAAAQARTLEPPTDDPEPEPGDLVQHFAFGLCEVLSFDGETLRIRDRQPPNRIREVRLAMLRVLSPVDHEGRRLFKLQRKV